jgi:hypothetical protein
VRHAIDATALESRYGWLAAVRPRPTDVGLYEEEKISSTV